MAHRTWPAPRTFGELADGQGIMFICNGCGRTHAVDRHEALHRWGMEGRPHEIADRGRCRYCGRNSMRAERCAVTRDHAPTEGARGKGPWDHFVRMLDKMKTDGSVR